MPEKKPVSRCDARRLRTFLTSDRWRRVVVQLQLSSRQREILERLFFGDTDTLVAERLHISCRTVETHLHRMFDKIGVGSRVELLVTVLLTYDELIDTVRVSGTASTVRISPDSKRPDFSDV